MYFFSDLSPHLQASLQGTTIVSKKDQVGVAVVNVGYSSGIHQWDFYCPFSTEGIKFGIVKEGFTLEQYTGHFFQFKTTTPRTVSVILNLEERTLQFKLNGHLSTSKGVGKNLSVNEQLEQCTWYPCVLMSQCGNQIQLQQEIQDLSEYRFQKYTNFQMGELKISQYCGIDENIVLQGYCQHSHEKYIRISKYDYEFLYESKVWECVEVSKDFIKQFTNIYQDQQQYYYLELSESKTLLNIIQFLECNIKQLENNLSVSHVDKKNIKEDQLLNEIQQVFDQVQCKQIIEQEEKGMEKELISIEQSNLLIRIIIQLLDQMKIHYKLYSPYNRLKTFADHPCIGNPIELCQKYYLESGYGTNLKEMMEIPLVIHSLIQYNGQLLKSRSKRYAASIEGNFVHIYNRELEVFQCGKIDLRKLGPYTKQQKCVVLNQQEAPSQIYKILENYLNVETEMLSIYDQKLLAELIGMGFEEKASKEALIQSSNQLMAAIDMLSSMPKPWTCPICTLINNEYNTACEACDNPKPEGEILEDKPLQPLSAEKENIVLEENEEIPQDMGHTIENGEINQVLLIHLEGTLTPLLIVSVHQNSVVSIKQLSHDEEYLQQFYEEGYCTLTNQWSKNPQGKEVIQESLKYGHQIIETLAPLYSPKITKKLHFNAIDHKAFLVQNIQQVEYVIYNLILYLLVLSGGELSVFKISLDPLQIQQLQILNANNKLSSMEIDEDGQVTLDKQFTLSMETLQLIPIHENKLSEMLDCINDEEVQVCDLFIDDKNPRVVHITEPMIDFTVNAIFETPTVPKYMLPQKSILQLSKQVINPIPIPLTVHSYQGASFNNTTFVTSMLYDMAKPFISNYPNTEFVFRHQQADKFCVAHVVVKSDLTNTQRGFPIGCGLIFTGECFKGAQVFDQMELEEYKQWREYRYKIPIPLQDWEPVGCFEFAGQQVEVTCKLDFVRPSTYILLKPTNFRKEPFDQTSHFLQNSIEIKQFIAYGRESNDQDNSIKYNQESSILLEELRKRVDMTVSSQVYECLVTARQKARYTHRQDCELDIPNNCELEFVTHLSEKELRINPIKSEFRLLRLRIRGRRCKSVKHFELRQQLLNVSENSQIHNQLIESLYNGKQSIQILNQLMHNKNVIEYVKKHINVYKFLVVHVLPTDMSACVAQFLAILQVHISDQLVAAAQQILNKINKLIITESGLESFLQLLKFIGRDNKQIGRLLFDSLQYCLHNLQQLGDHQFKDSYIFSTKYTMYSQLPTPTPDEKANKVTEPENQTIIMCKQDPISQLAIANYSPKYQIRTFKIYFLGEFELNKLQLRFQSVQNVVSFRVQIWDESHLILDQCYPEYIFIQFTQFTQNCLRIPLPNVRSRKLNVQFTLGSPTIYCKSSDQSAIPQNNLIIFPEFYGTLIDPKIKEIDLGSDYKYKNTILFGDTLYHTYENNEEQLLDSYDAYVKRNNIKYIMVAGKSAQNTEYLEDAILKLQTEMQLKQKHNMPTEHLKSLIESAQVELLRVAPPRNYENNQNFLTTLSCNIIQVLQDLQHESLITDKQLESLIILGDRGTLSDMVLQYYSQFYKVQNVNFLLDMKIEHAFKEKLLRILQLPIKETLKLLIHKSQENEESLINQEEPSLYDLLNYHIKTEQNVDVELLNLAFKYLFIDSNFKISLVQTILSKSTAKQIKEVVTDEFLKSLSQVGLRHPEKFRVILDQLFIVRVLPNKYVDWSAMQFLSQEEKEDIESEKEALNYVSRKIVYFYQQMISNDLLQDNILIIFDFLSSAIMRLNKERDPAKKRKKAENEFDDFMNRSHIQICSSKTIHNLIDLLKSEQQPSLIPQYLLKIVSLMNPQQINEEQLYTRILQYYKNVNYHELLEFTLKLISQELQQSSTCSQVILSLLELMPHSMDLQNIFIAVSDRIINVKLKNIHLIYRHFGEYLKANNVGGKEGCTCASLTLIHTLTTINSFLKLIIQSEQTSLQCCVCPALEAMIEWYCFNCQSNISGSPSLYILSQITYQFDILFDLLEPKSQILQCFFQNLQKIDKHENATYITHNLVKSISELVIAKFDKYLLNDEIALQLTKNTPITLNLISKINQNSFPPVYNEEEFGSKMKVVNLPGQNQPINIDWSVHKKGVKSRLAILPLPGQYCSDYHLIFQLDNAIQLKNLKIGFQTYSGEFTDKVLGTPDSILLSVGMTQDELHPVQYLDFINDEFYSQFQVKVFAYNGCYGKEIIPEIRTAKFISLRIKTPIMQMVDGCTSWIVKHCHKQCLGINFCSVMGFQMAQQPTDYRVQESTAVELLSKLCRPTFHQTLKNLAHDQSVLSKIKQSFNQVMQAMMNYSQQLSPLVMAICDYNVEFGNWIAKQLMNSQSQLQHAKLLTQIITSNQVEQVKQERFQELHKYLIPKLQALDKTNNKSQDIILFQQMAPFIDTYCNALLLNSKNSREKQRSQVLQVSKYEILELIELMHLISSYSTSKLLIKLIANLTYLPHPFIQIEETEQILTYTLDKANLQPEYLEVLAPLVLGSEQSIEWISKQLDRLTQNLIKALGNVEMNHVFIHSCIKFLNNVIQQTKCSDILVNHLQDIYTSLIDQSEQKILKQLEDGTQQQFTKFLQTMLQKYEQKSIIQSLIKDINKLTYITDMKFVQLLLVPLLNTEEFIQVSFNFKEDEKYIIDPRQAMRESEKKELRDKDTHNYTIDSNLLTTDQSKSIIESLKTDFSFQRVAFQKCDGDSTMIPVLEDKFLNSTPSMIILNFRKNGTSQQTSQEGLFGMYLKGGFVGKEDKQYDKIYQYNGDSVLFTFKDNKIVTINENIIAKLDIYDGQGTFVFEFGGKTFLMIEYVEGECSHLSLDFMEIKSEQYLLDSIKVEYMISKKEERVLYDNLTYPILQQLGHNYNISTLGYGDLSNLLFTEQFFDSSSAINYYSVVPIYYLPSHLTLSQIKKLMSMNKYGLKEDSKILEKDIVLKKLDKNELQYIEIDIDSKQFLEDIDYTVKQNKWQYQQLMTIFPMFEEQNGVQVIIEVIKKAIALWKNEQRAKVWLQFIDELWAFCHLPNFFKLFMKNQLCVNLLFDLLAGIPDQQANNKKWEEEEQNAVKFVYATLIKVFSSSTSSEVRIKALENNLIQHILDRITLVSKENKRKYHEQVQEEKEEIVNAKEERDSPKQAGKKPLKKKGIGYASDNTGQNSKWNTAEYVEKKQQRSNQLISLLGIVESFFDFSHWHPSDSIIEQLKKTLYESSLLPLLESAFRSGSLLEISKEFDLYSSYLKIVKSVSKHQMLAPIFLPIPENFLPRQTQSIQELLTMLSENANIYLNCMTTTSKKNDQGSSEVAHLIIETQKQMEECINRYQSGQSDSDEEVEDQKVSQDQANALIKTLLSKPLDYAYRSLLQELRFGYIDMKLNGRYKHHYQSFITPNHTPSSNKIVRLAQEFADMSTSLPIEHTNAIFVRADKERVDVIKALVMGAKGTPYAHGAFLFDIYADDNYPQGPPKMNLSTTGNGKIRFNPNLYSCGKVCLSLLGTWRGNASENWDPKLSTLLQVLVSTQAIIMSEEVYFNEPGFEQEAGSEEGEKKNEAYSNIVRYGNIRYAMIDQIRDPPKGFESIVRRHFYLKKDEILEECRKWIEYADTRDASYAGLINDHNSSWCNEFKKNKKAYHKKLVEAVAELETELNKIQPPSAADLEGSKVLKAHLKNQPKVKNIKEGMANLDEVDVTEDLNVQKREFLASDASVMDRWSRYIGAMGMDAVKKQSNSSIFIYGVNALGIEIAKNIVLSGVKQLTIYDSQIVDEQSLLGQFFLNESDLGKNKAQSCVNKLQQLNSYVKVDCLTQMEQIDILKQYTLIILSTKVPTQELLKWSTFCREHKIKIIISSVDGVYARVLNDFGESFQVDDKNGEQVQELIIKSIQQEEDQLIINIIGKHDLQDGDVVIIDNVEGMEFVNDKTKSINKTIHKIKVVSKQQIAFQSQHQFTPFIRNGTVKLVKLPVAINFKPINQQFLETPDYDPSLTMYDFVKADYIDLLHKLYQNMPYEESQKNQEYAQKYKNTHHLGEFPPLAAFMGGFVAQEAIKAITNKFMPVHQACYFDCSEVLGDVDPDAPLLTRFLGKELTQKLEQSKVFMIGCGAIGCELLKNFAMINLGVQGCLTITDPDHIETSNLNRQFLFREKHLRKPKSSTAAAAILQMNPKLKNHIIARLDKVHEGTEHIFTEQFFEEQSVVANALDNVAARRYVDRRCVDAKVPLLESGTLGPKGHVQCIIPYQTESYGSSNDPVEDGEIPYCTLKMFPEEAFHCVEFARDKFSKLFSIRPKNIQKMLEPSYKPSSSEENKQLREAIKILKYIPQTYADCIGWARKKFEKYFVNDIQQLLYTYPLDAKTKDGNLFWTMPKRPPTPIPYNPNDPLHVTFVSTLAYLKANMFGLNTKDWRSNRETVAKSAAEYVFPEWAPSEEKKKNISSQVNKNESKEEQQEEEQEEVSTQQETEVLFTQFLELKGNLTQLKAEDFEKDDDKNGHIDFIYSFGNLRASNYKLELMDWLTVKLKAGRIVPALATTTAVVAGLQTIELIKTLKQIKVENMKNAFVNLAIPYIQLTEPGPAPKIKLSEEVTVTLWDRWDLQVTRKTTLNEVFGLLQEKYKLYPKNVFLKGAPIYMEMMMKSQSEKQAQLEKQLSKLMSIEGTKYIDLTINFTQNQASNEIIKGVPLVRLWFKAQ